LVVAALHLVSLSRTVMSAFTEQMPESIVYGKGIKMTFLRNDPYVAKNEISESPDAETLYVPPHWHETHDEIMRVVEGKLEIRLGPNVGVYTAQDGEVLIKRGVVHSLRTFKGVGCVFYERTEPMDEEKEIFFRNLLGTGSFPAFMDGIVTCYWGDTFPGFPGHVMWFEKLFVTAIGGHIAPWLGYKRKYTSLKREE